MAIEVEIYEKIRHLHEHENMSQRSIAKILGISRNTVKRYFDGSHVPWEREGTSGRTNYVTKDTSLFLLKLTSYFFVNALDGTKVNKGSVSCKSFKLIERRKSLLIERRTAG